MLLEPGPVAPVDVNAWTQPGARTTFAADAASLAGQLGAAGSTIAGMRSAIASSGPPRMETDAGLDLAAAVAAHDAQVRDIDSAIATVAGNADAHVGEIAGLSNDTAADIAAGEPGFPRYDEHPPNASWPIGEANPPDQPPDSPGPEGDVAALITAYYNKYLRRNPGLEGINAWAPLWPNQDAIEHGILFSQEYADRVDQLYQAILERNVESGELAEHRAHKDSLDDVEDQARARA